MDINLGSASPGISAMIARLTSVLLSSPMEKLKTSVQGTGSGQFSLFSSGFQGFRATVIRDLIYSGTFFSLLENTHATLKDKHYLFSRTVSCTLAAVTAVLITHPFDVVKTKLQTRNSHYYELEKNPFSALKYLCKNEGCHALTTGIWPRMGKLVLGVNIYINFYEFLKKFFDNLIAIK